MRKRGSASVPARTLSHLYDFLCESGMREWSSRRDLVRRCHQVVQNWEVVHLFADESLLRGWVQC